MSKQGNREYKEVRMTPEGHAVIKQYTKEQGYFFAKFVEECALDYIRRERAKEARKAKV